MVPIREVPLANGLVITCHDTSTHYFGEYYRVKVVVSLEIGVPDNVKTVDREGGTASETFTYRRVLERMAVREAEMPQVMETLVDKFLLHARPYLESADFPQQAYQAELRSVRHRHDRQRDYRSV